jgi:hypothetical protein
MVSLGGPLEKGLHSHKPSIGSGLESEISHQPSAEFLERLERVNKQEPFISSGTSDNMLTSGDFRVDAPLFQSAIQSDNGKSMQAPDKED